MSNAKPSVMHLVTEQPKDTLPEILRGALSEFDVWTELGLMPEGNATVLFTKISQAIRNITEASSKNAVVAVVNAIAEECKIFGEVLETSVVTLPPEPTFVEFALVRLGDEINRRKGWLKKHGEVSAEWQALLEEGEGERDTARIFIRDYPKGDIREKYVQQLAIAERKISMVNEVQKQNLAGKELVLEGLEELMRFHRAQEEARTSVSKDLFSEKLPPIREVTPELEDELTRQEVQDSEDDKAAHVTPVDVEPKVDGDVSAKLLSSMLEIEMLIYSLFDLFGTDNANLGKRSRGTSRVITTALKVFKGLGGEHSEQELRKFILSGTRANQHGFLMCSGSVGEIPTWKRTDKPLPWNPREMFTEEEIQEFLTKIQEKQENKLLKNKIKKKK